MGVFLKYVQRFASILMCTLPVYSFADAPKVVHVGYQKSGFLLLVRSEGTLEKRLEPLGYAVEWHEFTSGPPLLEAMNSQHCRFRPQWAAPTGICAVKWERLNAAIKAAGLRVPKAIGDFLILDAIRDSHGIALSVSDHEMIAAARAIERILIAPFMAPR